MSAVLPLRKILGDQANISFVDESGALQGVAGTLSLQVVVSDAAQLVINERHQGVERLAVSTPPAAQQLRDLASRSPLHPQYPP